MFSLLAAAEAGALETVAQAPAGSAAALAWLIPVVPAVTAGLLMILGKRLGPIAAWIAIAAAAVSALLSTWVFAFLQSQPEGGRVLVHSLGTWMSIGSFEVEWALLVDPLSTIMILLVTWVGLLIHIYSVGYMHGDPRYHQFFAYLNLFLASMLILVLGESLLVTFIGWELVGLCSYLLIGFWFSNRAYAGAAKKAFVVNRVGDVGFMIAMFVTFGAFGTLSYVEVLPAAATTLAAGTAVAIALLLFAGATGKSAQIPLYVWLPDAMAGPTPVSALIHAATMVTAGVFLVARTSPIFAVASEAAFNTGLLVAWVGGLTALLAALIACVQNDIKKILAYSTVSQLGYMFIAVGLGSQVAGVFHLLTHGFFKALLFLAAGSVMHAMLNRTDVWGMGGLWRAMPITFVTSAIATLAIAGIPPLSGFWSKEEVLVAALDTPGAQGIWILGTLVAGLTAFYMARWFFLIFLGRPRWGRDAVTGWSDTTADRAARAAADVEEPHPHESPLTMTVPLMILAVGAAAGGLLEYPPGEGFLHGWLAPSVTTYVGDTAFINHAAAQVIVVVTGLIGVAAAYVMYVRRSVHAPALDRLTGPYRAAYNRFYVDEAYSAALVRPGHILADGFAAFDRRGIDGLVNGSARLTGTLAGWGRRLQTGFVRSYALAVLAGAVLVTVLFLGTMITWGG
jgi:NADH-quinone oxidoreductase subunit L